MNDSALVGGVLFAGLVIFLVGAVAWRLDYQRPLEESLPIISGDRRRRAWIHTWMIAALVITPTGLAGLTVAITDPTAAVLSAMATAAYLWRRWADRVAGLPPDRGSVGGGSHRG